MARWSELIFDGETPDPQQVQAPVQRPAPVERPGATYGGPAPRQRTPQINPLAPAPQDADPTAALRKGWTDEADALAAQNNARAERDRMRKPAPQQPEQRQGRRWSEQIFEGPEAALQPLAAAQPKAPVDPNAEPDAKTWLGRRWQDIRGKQDPRYQGLPAISEVMMREKSTRDQLPWAKDEAVAWTLGASDEDMAQNYKSMLGDRFVGIEKDANGYPIIQYRDPSGNVAKAYANVPGLDMQDVARGAFGALPFAGAGMAASAGLKGAGVGARMVGQGLTQGTTSVATDVTRGATGYGDVGSLSDVGTKAALTAGLGVGAEGLGAVASSIYRRLVTEPGLYDAAKGQLTEAGLHAARQAGIADDMLTPEFSRIFAREFARHAEDPALAGNIASSRVFNIPRTAGELRGDKNALLREQQMRGGTYGQDAQNRMKAFDDRQREAIANAVRGEIEPGQPGIAGQLAPLRAGEAATMSKGDTGYNIRANTQAARDAAQNAEDFTWSFVPRNVTPTDESLGMLRQHLNEAIGGFPVQGAARNMAQDLDAFLAGRAPEKAANWITYDPAGNVDMFRKRLSAHLADAVTPTEKRAAGAMYDAFNSWVRDAAERQLLNGANPFDVAKMTIARDTSRQIREVFQGQQGSPGARILKDVLQRADSPEGIVNALFTGPTAEIKGGTMSALVNLKRAYDTYLDTASAKAAWDDIRLAYWLRVTSTKGNEAAQPAQLASSIKNALGTQENIVHFLYSPTERASMRRLAAVMDQVKSKNPNTSWSGIAVGALMKDLGNTLISAIGFNSVLAKTAGSMMMKAPTNAFGRVQAGIATGGGQGASIRPQLPSYGWAGGTAGARSESD